MSWTALPQTEAHKFLESVRDESLNVFFREDLCEVYTLPLDFYEGYCLYRIVNKFMMPHYIMDFISNGEDHLFLDGSDIPFQNLNAQYAISLNGDNVIDYVGLYIAYVYERGSSLEFPPHQDHKNHIRILSMQDDVYAMECEIIYQSERVTAHIDVHTNGMIDVKSPVQVQFLDGHTTQSQDGYRHPQSDDIVEGIKGLLSTTEKGASFLNVIDEQKIAIHILNSPDYMGLTTSSNTVYLSMPAVEQTSKFTHLIVAACYIRDAFHLKTNYFRPHPSEDEDVYAALNHNKNFDMILETCIMVEELEEQGYTEAVQVIERIGVLPLYKAQKNDTSTVDNLMSVYTQCMEDLNV